MLFFYNEHHMQHDCLYVEEITMEKKYLIILSTVIISLAGAVGLIYCDPLARV